MNLLSLVGPWLDNIYQIRRKWYYLSGWNFLQSKQGPVFYNYCGNILLLEFVSSVGFVLRLAGCSGLDWRFTVVTLDFLIIFCRTDNNHCVTWHDLYSVSTHSSTVLVYSLCAVFLASVFKWKGRVGPPSSTSESWSLKDRYDHLISSSAVMRKLYNTASISHVAVDVPCTLIIHKYIWKLEFSQSLSVSLISFVALAVAAGCMDVRRQGSVANCSIVLTIDWIKVNAEFH
jgi:hypothetical protein